MRPTPRLPRAGAAAPRTISSTSSPAGIVEVDGSERPALVGRRVERVLLVREERARHGPALALAAEQVGVGDDGAVEVHEVELGRARSSA